MEKNNETTSWFFENIYKIGNPLTKLIRTTKEKIFFSKIKYKEGISLQPYRNKGAEVNTVKSCMTLN